VIGGTKNVNLNYAYENSTNTVVQYTRPLIATDATIDRAISVTPGASNIFVCAFAYYDELNVHIGCASCGPPVLATDMNYGSVIFVPGPPTPAPTPSPTPPPTPTPPSTPTPTQKNNGLLVTVSTLIVFILCSVYLFLKN